MQTKYMLNEQSETIAKGKVVMIRIDPHNVIDDIKLEFLNNGAPATVDNIKKAIGNISLKINGNDDISCPLSCLFDLYEQLGVQINQPLTLTNVIGLNIARLLFKTPQVEDFFAWGCADVKTIQIHMFCNLDVTGVTDVNVQTERRKFEAPLGSVITVKNYSQKVKSSGLHVMTGLPYNQTNKAFLSIGLYDGGGKISSGEISTDLDTVIQPTSKSLMDYTINARGYKALENCYSFPFFDGSMRQFLPMSMKQLTVRAEYSEAPTNSDCDCIVVAIEGIPIQMADAWNFKG